ncbi:MAG TPA: ABC transporter substrate-binding protein [Zeimonas sp.]|nr:ABC transporter substrate-binding protein [Zeimonas sp.]
MKHRLLRALVACAGFAVASAAQADISGGVVRIGVMNDMSGPYSDVTGRGSVVAAQMAAEDYVAATGSKLKVEIVFADHQNKPDVGSAIARKWYDAEGVDAIVDVPASSVGLAVNQITREKGKAFIAVGSGTTELSGKSCSPNTVQWLYDTWLQANATGSGVVRQGGDTWFFLTADYAYGHSLERELSKVVVENGGKVLGSAKVPLGTQDYSSFLLQAQASGAKIIGLGNAGADTINSIKQAAEFGLTKSGQKLVAFLLFIPDISGLGLEAAQGLQTTQTFYWDLNEQTREWSKRFAARHGNKYPTSVHAGVYSGVLHYLKAVDAANTDDGTTVIARMKEMPTDDPLFGKGSVRPDGRKIHPAYLFEVKKPSESKYDFDYLKVVATIPAEQTAQPLAESQCPLVKAGS